MSQPYILFLLSLPVSLSLYLTVCLSFLSFFNSIYLYVLCLSPSQFHIPYCLSLSLCCSTSIFQSIRLHTPLTFYLPSPLSVSLCMHWIALNVLIFYFILNLYFFSWHALVSPSGKASLVLILILFTHFLYIALLISLPLCCPLKVLSEGDHPFFLFFFF